MKDDFAIEKKIEVFKDKDGRLKFVVRSNSGQRAANISSDSKYRCIS